LRIYATPDGESHFAEVDDGIVEFETSDGEIRHVSAGGYVLAEDTHGKVCHRLA
jgi:hypothetical protein